MNLENLLEQIPEYAKDLKLNAKTIILDNQLLSKKQVAIIAVASAIATKNQQLKEATINQFTNDLDEKELSAAKAAAAIMAMNNIYYRFLDLIELEEYSKIPAGPVSPIVQKLSSSPSRVMRSGSKPTFSIQICSASSSLS